MCENTSINYRLKCDKIIRYFSPIYQSGKLFASPGLPIFKFNDKGKCYSIDMKIHYNDENYFSYTTYSAFVKLNENNSFIAKNLKYQII